MDIKTHIRKRNVKTAKKILRQGRGAWGEFVNQALKDYANATIIMYDGNSPPTSVKSKEQ